MLYCGFLQRIINGLSRSIFLITAPLTVLELLICSVFEGSAMITLFLTTIVAKNESPVLSTEHIARLDPAKGVAND